MYIYLLLNMGSYPVAVSRRNYKKKGKSFGAATCLPFTLLYYLDPLTLLLFYCTHGSNVIYL